MKVAMVSEHASPLATLGGVDAGGQNVHVAALAAAMARRGVDVVVHTRRDAARAAPGAHGRRRHASTTYPPGRPREVPKDDLFPYMDDFAADLHRQWARDAARRRPRALLDERATPRCRPRRPLGIPVVMTFHALGVVKRRHQGAADTSPPERLGGRGAARPRGRPRRRHLQRRGVRAAAPRRRPHARSASSRAGSTPSCSPRRTRPTRARPAAHRLVYVGRLVERKGIGNAISALAGLVNNGGPDTELVVVGGPDAADVDTDPQVARLRALAAHGARRRPRALPRPRRPRAGCPPCCAAPTPSSACPGTSRSASCRSRPWPAACPSSPPPSAASSTPSSTAAPACTSRRATPSAVVEALRGAARATRPAARVRRRRRPPRPRPLLLGPRRGSHPAVLRRPAPRRGAGSRKRCPPHDRPDRCCPAAPHVAALLEALPLLDPDQLDALGRPPRPTSSSAAGACSSPGNGGSAAQAQHLTAELVGRYRDDRPALSAIALHAETSARHRDQQRLRLRPRLRPAGAGARPSRRRLPRHVHQRPQRQRPRRHGGRPRGRADRLGDDRQRPQPAGRAGRRRARRAGAPRPRPCRRCTRSRCTWCAPPSTSPVGADRPSSAVDPHPDPLHPVARVTARRRRRRPARPRPRRHRRPALPRRARARRRRAGAGLAAPAAPGWPRCSPPPTAARSSSSPRWRGRRRPRAAPRCSPPADVRVVDLGLDGATPEKVRVRSDGRSLLRLDRGGAPGTPGDLTDEAARRAGRGRRRARRRLRPRASPAAPGCAPRSTRPRRAPVVWDPHPRGPEPVPGCTLVTPNGGEAAHFAARPRPAAPLAAATGPRPRAGRRAGAPPPSAVTLSAPRRAASSSATPRRSVVPGPRRPVLRPLRRGRPVRLRRRRPARRRRAAQRGRRRRRPRRVARSSPPGGAAAVRGRRARRRTAGARAATRGRRGRPGPRLRRHRRRHRRLLRPAARRPRRDAAAGPRARRLPRRLPQQRRLASAGSRARPRPLVARTTAPPCCSRLDCVDAVVVFDEDTPAAALARLRPDVWAKGGDYAVAVHAGGRRRGGVGRPGGRPALPRRPVHHRT